MPYIDYLQPIGRRPDGTPIMRGDLGTGTFSPSMDPEIQSELQYEKRRRELELDRMIAEARAPYLQAAALQTASQQPSGANPRRQMAAFGVDGEFSEGNPYLPVLEQLSPTLENRSDTRGFIEFSWSDPESARRLGLRVDKPYERQMSAAEGGYMVSPSPQPIKTGASQVFAPDSSGVLRVPVYGRSANPEYLDVLKKASDYEAENVQKMTQAKAGTAPSSSLPREVMIAARQVIKSINDYENRTGIPLSAEERKARFLDSMTTMFPDYDDLALSRAVQDAFGDFWGQQPRSQAQAPSPPLRAQKKPEPTDEEIRYIMKRYGVPYDEAAALAKQYMRSPE